MIGSLGFFRSGTGEIGRKTFKDLAASLIILVGGCVDCSLGAFVVGCKAFFEGCCAGGSASGFEGSSSLVGNSGP